MNSLPTPAAVVFVSDVDRVSRFYRELASMSVILQDDTHVVLAIAGFQLVVHGLGGEPPVRADAAGRVRVRQDSYVKVCLPVRSIATARAAAAANGGEVKPAESEWDARERGFRACDGHDPEGNVFQVREALR